MPRPRSAVICGFHCASAAVLHQQPRPSQRARRLRARIVISPSHEAPSHKQYRPHGARAPSTGTISLLKFCYCLLAIVCMPSPIDLMAVAKAFESMLRVWESAWNSAMVLWNCWAPLEELLPASLLSSLLSSTTFCDSSPSASPMARAIASIQLLPAAPPEPLLLPLPLLPSVCCPCAPSSSIRFAIWLWRFWLDCWRPPLR